MTPVVKVPVPVPILKLLPHIFTYKIICQKAGSRVGPQMACKIGDADVSD